MSQAASQKTWSLHQSRETQLREKIDQAKSLLSLPKLMENLGRGEHAKKTAHCPFHDDEHKSFSVFKGEDSFWHWKCHAGCGEGDEIMFLVKHFGISRREAIRRYLEMAGFPPAAPRSRECPKSHEYPDSLELPKSPKSPKSPKAPAYPEYREYRESPECPVYPVSNGQGLDGETEKALKGLAARNACTERNTARKRRFKLLRDLRAVEKGIGRELEIAELMPAFDEWHRLSQPVLDPAKTPDDYLAAFVAELGKVRVPTGEGETLKKALEA